MCQGYIIIIITFHTLPVICKTWYFSLSLADSVC